LTNSQVVIDSSFLLKILLPEDKSEHAENLWKGWIKNSIKVAAPTLIVFEVSSVLRNKIYRGILENDDAKELINQIKHLDLILIYTEDLLDSAWEIGEILKPAVLYDCFYIALSKFLGSPLWTADRKLYNSAKEEFPFINVI
jgi:predicted nucleic acid-binding protein